MCDLLVGKRLWMMMMMMITIKVQLVSWFGKVEECVVVFVAWHIWRSPVNQNIVCGEQCQIYADFFVDVVGASVGGHLFCQFTKSFYPIQNTKIKC